MMKRTKIFAAIAILSVATFVVIAADHIDAPGVQGSSSDITDLYAFQGEDNNNLVFVANLQGLLSPSATSSASFDENVLIEFKIDTNGDNVEDLVIQAIPRDGVMYFFGPIAPSQTGLSSTIMADAAMRNQVNITSYGQSAIIENANGMKFFAGPRDDPFFFDFAQYSAILNGEASGFNNPGSDTFAGSNVLSVVVEVPKSMIGGSGTINTWVTTNRKQ